MIHYEDFTLALSADGSLVEVWDSPVGRTSAPFVPPQLGAGSDLAEAAELQYRDLGRRHRQEETPAPDLMALGRSLFASLCPPPIAELLDRAMTRAAGSDGRYGVRLRLVLRWPSHLRHLQALPWEILSAPGGNFLVRQPLSTVVRTPLAAGHLATLSPVEPPLRILVLLSQPPDTTRLSLDEEKQRIIAALGHPATLYGIGPPRLKILEAPVTVAAFAATLRENFHVVHFAGHGDFGASGAGILELETEDGRSRPFDGRQLAEHLRLCPSLRLVVLNACWSALPGSDGRGEADLGVGTALAEQGVPAVVAMQRPIADDAATELAGQLYAQLALGDPLELALCHCRVKLAERYPETPSWAIPVLLMGASDGEIVTPAGQPPALSSAVARHVRNVRALIAEKTANFVGRGFLFDLVHGELAKGAACVLLTAEPGFGKTSFLAEWVKRHRHVHHFNRLTSADSNQAEHFLANITAQLILRYELPYPVLPVQALRDPSFFLDICEQAATKLRETDERLVLVVDALDEVVRQDTSSQSNPLDLPDTLPPGCSMVLTARPDQAKLRFQGHLVQHLIDPQRPENQADLAEFIGKFLDRGEIPAFCRARGQTPQSLADELLERSDGNFMYLRYMLEDLESGRQRADLEALPQGLVNYYELQWRRLRDQSGALFFELAVPALAALTDLRGPASVSMIAQLIDRPRERPRIAALFRELRQFLRVEDQPEQPGVPAYQLYHGSFLEFVKGQPEIVEQRMADAIPQFLEKSRRDASEK